MDRKLVVYGHEYCPDALRMRGFLERGGIAYEWRDIVEGDPRWRDELRLMANGYLSVPTVIFPNGEVLVEPNPREVRVRLKQDA